LIHPLSAAKEGAIKMKFIVHCDGLAGQAKRSLARAKKLGRKEKIAPEVTLTFADPLDMLDVLTPKRLKIVKAARQGKYSVSSLAAILNRDLKSVRRDVVKLEQAGMLRTYEETNPGHGRVRIVESIAQKLELRASL
jgi:predicted transcriptional regulator